jgi:hypothetical protein
MLCEGRLHVCRGEAAFGFRGSDECSWLSPLCTQHLILETPNSRRHVKRWSKIAPTSRCARTHSVSRRDGLAELRGAVSGHRDFIVKLAVQYGLLAVYGHRTWVDRGGLISYGPDLLGRSVGGEANLAAHRCSNRLSR